MVGLIESVWNFRRSKTVVAVLVSLLYSCRSISMCDSGTSATFASLSSLFRKILETCLSPPFLSTSSVIYVLNFLSIDRMERLPGRVSTFLRHSLPLLVNRISGLFSSSLDLFFFKILMLIPCSDSLIAARLSDVGGMAERRLFYSRSWDLKLISAMSILNILGRPVPESRS